MKFKLDIDYLSSLQVYMNKLKVINKLIFILIVAEDAGLVGDTA